MSEYALIIGGFGLVLIVGFFLYVVLVMKKKPDVQPGSKEKKPIPPNAIADTANKNHREGGTGGLIAAKEALAHQKEKELKEAAEKHKAKNTDDASVYNPTHKPEHEGHHPKPKPTKGTGKNKPAVVDKPNSKPHEKKPTLDEYVAKHGNKGKYTSLEDFVKKKGK